MSQCLILGVMTCVIAVLLECPVRPKDLPAILTPWVEACDVVMLLDRCHRPKDLFAIITLIPPPPPPPFNIETNLHKHAPTGFV